MPENQNPIYRLASSKIAVAVAGIVLLLLLAAVFFEYLPLWLFLTILIVAIVGVVLYVVLRDRLARKRDESFGQAMDDRAKKQINTAKLNEQREIKSLQRKWQEGFDRLRQSKKSVYFLPWYVIIGRSGAGKTKAIQNSGMHFPFGEVETKGVGGTRNCDWFFAEEAILLDTAGRYATGTQSSSDSQEWLSFLELLRKYRRDMPVNGLIIAVSADDLITQDAAKITSDARHLRSRLDELVQQLHIQFPVYLIVTKCDLVQGFSDFFSRVPKGHVTQMLGWTNPDFAMDAVQQQLEEFFTTFRQRAADMRPGLMKDEADPITQRNIYLFPEELKGLTESLLVYCDTLFRETPYNESAFLRGVYFTSALQGEGNAISPILERLGLAPHASEEPVSSKSFFLQDFFQERLSDDGQLVTPTGSATVRMRVANNVGLAAIAVICVAVFLLSTASYGRNKRLLNSLQHKIANAQNLPTLSPEEQAARLKDYWTDIDELRTRVHHPDWLERFGLFKGGKALPIVESRFNETYEGAAFRPALDAANAALTQQTNVAESVDGLDALIAYLGEAKRAHQKDLESGGESLARWWNRQVTHDAQMTDNFASAYRFYLRDPWRPPGDPGREKQADAERSKQLDAVKAAVPRLLTVEKVDAWLKTFTPPGQMPDQARAFVEGNPSVSPAFTSKAWKERVQPLVAKVDQVEPELDGYRTDAFVAAYAAAYYRQWYDLLLALREPTGSGAARLDPYCSPADPPYFVAMQSVRDALNVTFPKVDPPRWVASLDALLDKGAKDGYTNAVKPACSAKGQAPDPCAALTTPLDPLLDARDSVRRIVAVDKAQDNDDSALRARMEKLLLVPFDTASTKVSDDCTKYLSTKFKQADPQPHPSSSAADLQEVCAPNTGRAARFFQTLGPFFDPISGRPAPGTRVKVPSEIMQAFQEVHKCQQAFASHSIGFETLLGSDMEGQVRVNETTLTVRCGTQEPWILQHRNQRLGRTLRWTTECDDVELSIVVGSPTGGFVPQPQPKTAHGPFALLELLTEAETFGSEFRWTFQGGVKTAFRVTLREPGLLTFYRTFRPH